MKISIFKDAGDAIPKEADVTWEEIASSLMEHEVRDRKDKNLWSPASYHTNRRKAVNVEAVCCLVIDLDHCTPDVLKQARETLASYEYVIHSTFSHTIENGSYRIVVPFSEAIPATQWEVTWRHYMELFGLPVDESCKDAARMYYIPAHPPGAVPEVYQNKGKFLEPVLDPKVAPPPPKATKAMAPVTLKLQEGEYNQQEVFKQLKAVKNENSQLLARKIINGDSLDVPPGRDHFMNRVASFVASTVTPPLAWPAALHLLTPCLRATPEKRPGHFDHWVAEMEDMYARALQRRAQFEAEKANSERLSDAVRKAFTRREERTEAAGGQVVEPDSEDWENELDTREDPKTGNITLIKDARNAGVIFKHDPLWRGTFRFNDVTKNIDVASGPLFGKPISVYEIAARNWLSGPPYKLRLSKHEVADQIWAVANENKYDPLADSLLDLVWDGTPRVSTFLADIYGANGDPRYLKRVSECFLIATTARALRPGCKVDTVLMLQGAQGIGKSTSLKLLAGDYFSDAPVNIHDKDSRALASRFWILELAELASVRRADNETLKAFISAFEDTFRPPYARAAETFKRRCVFVGTTNSEEYLSDPHGARRYWAVECTKVDLEKLRATRDQLWAEAVYRFQSGEQWWFEAEDRLLAASAAVDVTSIPPHVDAINQWWAKQVPRPEFVTSYNVACDALGFMKNQVDQRIQKMVVAAMRYIGFAMRTRRVHGTPQRVYFPPESKAHAPVAEATVTPIRKQ